MQYGDLKLSVDNLYTYLGTDPANDNFTFVDENSLRPSSKAVDQRDADLLHFWHKVFSTLVKVNVFIMVSLFLVTTSGDCCRTIKLQL